MNTTPFTQGGQAFLNEAPTASCQFPNGSTMHREWMDGWAQRQVSERAHRSRSMDATNVQMTQE